MHDQCGRLAVLHLGFHLDIGLRAVVVNAKGPEVLIPAGHPVAEIQFFGRDHRGEDVGLTFGLTFLGALINQVLLPLLTVLFFRIPEGNARDVLLRL